MERVNAVVSTPPPTTICASSARRWWVLSEAGSLEERISWKIVRVRSLVFVDSPARVRRMRLSWSWIDVSMHKYFVGI